MIHRHARTVGVLVVVATLVLWGGAAAANAPHAETSSQTTADDPLTLDGTAADVTQQEANASVTFDDQNVEDGTVTVQNVTLPEGGYVAIYDSTLLEGEAVDSVVGVSEYLEPGTHENVTVTLYEGVPGADFADTTAPDGDERFIAMPHMETSGDDVTDNETMDNETAGDDNETAGDDMPDNETIDDDVVDDGIVDNETTDNETTDNETTDGETTDNETVGDETTGDQTPGDDGADNETTDNETTDDGIADNEPVDDEMPDDETAGNETAGDGETTDNETTDDEMPGDGETTDNETAGDDTTDNETAGDDTTDNETADNETTDTPTTTNETFDFVATNGSEDVPYTTNGEPIVDSALLSFGDEAADDDEADGDDEAADDDDEADGETRGIVVDDFNAPAYAATNTTVTVNATLANEDPVERTEDVAFRIEGGTVDRVIHERVTVDANSSTNVTFELNTTNVSTDEYIHGVTAFNSSEFTTLTVTDDAVVDISEQATNDSNVTVSQAFLPEGGYVTIHDSTLFENETVDSVVGVSEYLEPGYYEDLTVTLDEELAENDTLVAMPHLETTDDETYDFVTSDGEDDGPYTTDDEPVTDEANVSVSDAENGAVA